MILVPGIVIFTRQSAVAHQVWQGPIIVPAEDPKLLTSATSYQLYRPIQNFAGSIRSPSSLNVTKVFMLGSAVIKAPTRSLAFFNFFMVSLSDAEVKRDDGDQLIVWLKRRDLT
jgi:hypothetical protein